MKIIATLAIDTNGDLVVLDNAAKEWARAALPQGVDTPADDIAFTASQLISDRVIAVMG